MTFDQLYEEILEEFPSFKFVNKRDSLFMKVLNVLLLTLTFGQQKEFMTNFITTIGYTVYVPDGWLRNSSELSLIAVMRHERVHMRQRRKFTAPLFTFLYLLFPLPIGLAYFRAKFEWEAYAETMRTMKELRGTYVLQDQMFKEHLIAHFTTAQYVWMWPFKKSVEKWYDDEVRKICS